MQMKWWEKTVEYLFVIESALLGKFNLSPLDGTHELAGDLIASENSTFILIEFKVDHKSIASEKSKFEDGKYEEAKELLAGYDGHHLIIYGDESKESPGQLILLAKTYFSEEAKVVREIYSNGIEIGYFHPYLERYLEFKKINWKTSGGGGRSLNFAMVAAVDSETGKASAMSLDEYFLTLKLELTKAYTKTYSSSFDMR
jgi:hypothetical protein